MPGIDPVTEFAEIADEAAPADDNMGVSTTPDLELDDGTPVRFLLGPADGPVPVPTDDDLPEGMGRAVPVARGTGPSPASRPGPCAARSARWGR